MELDSEQYVYIIILVREQVLMLAICLINITLYYPDYYTTYFIFLWVFCHFTCLYIMDGDILWIVNYGYDKYFSIAAWRESGGTCEAKVKEKWQKQS